MYMGTSTHVCRSQIATSDVVSQTPSALFCGTGLLLVWDSLSEVGAPGEPRGSTSPCLPCPGEYFTNGSLASILQKGLLQDHLVKRKFAIDKMVFQRQNRSKFKQLRLYNTHICRQRGKTGGTKRRRRLKGGEMDHKALMRLFLTI